MMKDGLVKPVLNVSDVPVMDIESPKGRFGATIGKMGHLIGTKKIGAMYTSVEPGKRAFPFHVHHAIEELFYIIEGEGEYRFGESVFPIRTGDVLAAPSGGPECAHQIVNTGDEFLKYLSISTRSEVDAVQYPDSDKFLIFSSEDGTPQNARMRYIGRQSSEIDYYDGEEENV